MVSEIYTKHINQLRKLKFVYEKHFAERQKQR
jgi:hypothetical protein